MQSCKNNTEEMRIFDGKVKTLIPTFTFRSQASNAYVVQPTLCLYVQDASD